MAGLQEGVYQPQIEQLKALNEKFGGSDFQIQKHLVKALVNITLWYSDYQVILES